MSRYHTQAHRPAHPPAQSATTRAYLHLKERILTCELAPGTSMFEGELAAELEMSKTPVREALGMLSHEGFVQVIPRQGYRVSDISLADVKELFGLRLLLEPEAARLAAARADPDTLAELGRLAAHDPDDDAGTRATQATAFHMALAHASGSARLAATLGNLLEEIQRLFFIGLPLGEGSGHAEAQTSGEHHDHGGHAALMDALDAGDADAAERLARQQVQASRDAVMAAIMATLAGSGPAASAEDVMLGQAL
ncbi:GntR family transcriptional regulator [Euzebya tangerina]|uniref:GntR family transcriptional regulator n=1 Tax=Euzebya tangerina TaxID=591198 RepID=UPI000E31C5B5|nr:GntR family transcriptional regulator [Euzebya tangerina]